MSEQAIRWALSSSVRGRERLVLLVLATQADELGRVDPYDARGLARQSRIRSDVVARILRDLMRWGNIDADMSNMPVSFAVRVNPEQPAQGGSRTRVRASAHARSGSPTGLTLSTSVSHNVDLKTPGRDTGTRLCEKGQKTHQYSDAAQELAQELWLLVKAKPLGGYVAFRRRIDEALEAGHTAEDLRTIAPDQRVWSRAAIELSLAKLAEAQPHQLRTPRYYDPDKDGSNWRDRIG